MTESPEERPRTDEEFDPAEGVGPPLEDPDAEPPEPGELSSFEETETPGRGGYVEGRDPKSDMPVMPSLPDTEEDAKSHDAEPPQTGEPQSTE